ncbi:hypothetical protein NA56DRAFT_752783 [Hyaloscypha hepaticicola]|uniref:Uncharacterized protein n=1 Tax=Hyaloscypha hepaticicola TaxID=2082293 RepID=A0A2J6PS16_9HELO|nr:hypothetical protein NA56DRAFT_752783 [Hyaloscypha hepaticicola]
MRISAIHHESNLTTSTWKLSSSLEDLTANLSGFRGYVWGVVDWMFLPHAWRSSQSRHAGNCSYCQQVQYQHVAENVLAHDQALYVTIVSLILLWEQGLDISGQVSYATLDTTGLLKAFFSLPGCSSPHRPRSEEVWEDDAVPLNAPQLATADDHPRRTMQDERT